MSLDIERLDNLIKIGKEKLEDLKKEKSRLASRLSVAEAKYQADKTEDNRQMVKGIRVECEEVKSTIDLLEGEIEENIDELKREPGFSDFVDEKLKEGYKKSFNRFIKKNEKLKEVKDLCFKTDKNGNTVITDFGKNFILLLEYRAKLQQLKAEMQENESILTELNNKDSLTAEELATKDEKTKKKAELGVKIGEYRKKFDSVVKEMAVTTRFTKDDLSNMISLFEGQEEGNKVMYVTRGKNGEIDLEKTIEKKMKWNSNQALNNQLAYKYILDRQRQSSQQQSQAQSQSSSQPAQSQNNTTAPLPVAGNTNGSRTGLFSRIGNVFSNLFRRIRGGNSAQSQSTQSQPAQSQPAQSQSTQSQPAQSDEWLDSLKFDVVADEYRKQREEIFSKANELRRQATNASRSNSNNSRTNNSNGTER